MDWASSARLAMRPSASLTGKRLKQKSGCSRPLSQLLPRQNARLNEELRKGHFIIHVPKKVAAGSKNLVPQIKSC